MRILELWRGHSLILFFLFSFAKGRKSWHMKQKLLQTTDPIKILQKGETFADKSTLGLGCLSLVGLYETTSNPSISEVKPDLRTCPSWSSVGSCRGLPFA